MRLTTQIHRFLISGAMLALFGGVLATQPTIQEQFDDAVLAEESLPELPVVIIIEKTPGAPQARSWRQMLPASLGPRRG
jgi:hypothetical protein